MCLAFIVEMPMSKAERVERRRVIRTKRKAVERKDLYTLDYIRHKYPIIYDEGARIWEQLNDKYPDKFDLRRTEEHRIWKKKPDQPFHIIQQQPINIPQITVTLQSTCPEETTEPPTNSFPYSEQPTNQHPPSSPESNPNSPTLPEPPAITRIPLNNIQLRIPLMKAPLMKAPTKQSTPTLQEENIVHPGVTAETLHIVTDEILQEDSTSQSLDEIDPETIDKIINELRADPNLQDTFNDMEEQLEIEQIGMEIDIPEDIRLEDELENIMFW